MHVFRAEHVGLDNLWQLTLEENESPFLAGVDNLQLFILGCTHCSPTDIVTILVLFGQLTGAASLT